MSKSVRLHIDTRNRISTTDDVDTIGTSGSCTVRFPRALRRVVASRLLNVTIPISFYQIDEYADSFFIVEEDGTELLGNIPHGNYTVSELMANLNTAIGDLVSTNTYSFTYDTITEKVKLARTAGAASWAIVSYSDEGDPTLMANILGFTWDGSINPYQGNAAFFIAESKYHGLRGIDTIYIMCPQLFDSSCYMSTGTQLNAGCIGSVPLGSTDQDGSINYSPDAQQMISFRYREERNITDLKFEFLAHVSDELWHVINFHGHDITMNLELETN